MLLNLSAHSLGLHLNPIRNRNIQISRRRPVGADAPDMHQMQGPRQRSTETRICGRIHEQGRTDGRNAYVYTHTPANKAAVESFLPDFLDKGINLPPRDINIVASARQDTECEA